mgnify:CR=1 FL=1
MSYTYQDFLSSGLDLAPLGFEPADGFFPYFCTPRGARIIGQAGVDGIHFCFVRGFGETVFAVSPMNLAPHFVHPLARSFSDFLRLLLACGHTAAPEQAWQWNQEQFAAYLEENTPSQEQKALLARLARQTGLCPMEHPFDSLQELQSSFDYGKIPYTEDFYDPDMNPDAPCTPQPWRVFFDGGFNGRGKGRAAEELPLNREFEWAGRRWRIPCLYLCGRGLVLDLCMRVEPSALQAFAAKWDISVLYGQEASLSSEQRMLLALDNPLYLEFRCVPHVNARALHAVRSWATVYARLSPEAAVEDQAVNAVQHYGLDPEAAWVIRRFSFPWATARKPRIRTLSVTLSQDEVSLPGPHFSVTGPGDTVSFSFEGQDCRLTVQEYEAQQMDWSSMPDKEVQRPEHYVAMSYTLAPELPDGCMDIADCDDGDRPRRPSAGPGLPEALSYAAVIGIISPASQSLPPRFGQKGQGRLRAACSSLHFEPVERVTWRMVFRRRQFDDNILDLLP